MRRFRLPWQQPPAEPRDPNAVYCRDGCGAVRARYTFMPSVPDATITGGLDIEPCRNERRNTPMDDQFQHEASSTSTGYYHLITCKLCGWRIGTCGSYQLDLLPRKNQHAELCRMPDSKPDPCGQASCIKCHP